MKKEVSPLVTIAAVVVILGIGVFAYLRSERRPPVATAPGSPGMPPQVSEEIQRRMQESKINPTKP